MNAQSKTHDQQTREFLGTLARMQTDGEMQETGEGMSGDDAADTLSVAIRTARELLRQPEIVRALPAPQNVAHYLRSTRGARLIVDAFSGGFAVSVEAPHCEPVREWRSTLDAALAAVDAQYSVEG